MKAAVLVLLLGVAGCSSKQALPSPDTYEPELPPIGDIAFETGTSDTNLGEVCEVLWQMRTLRSGATAHLAMGKRGELYVAAYQKLYALDPAKTGKQLWVWPDEDTVSGIGALEEQLYTPVVGLEGAVIVGSSQNRLLVINANGKARFAVPTQGAVSGAVALSADTGDSVTRRRIVALTDEGALYLIRDLGQNKPYVPWSLTEEAAFANPREGLQPLIGLPDASNHEVIWVVAKDAVHRVDLETGEVKGATPLPEGHTSTSNGILDETGRLWLLTGSNPSGNYYEASWLWAVAPDGTPEAGYPVQLYQTKTVALSLSQGIKNTLLIGTNNNGVMVYSLTTKSALWTNFKSYSDVSQPVQAADGTMYLGAWPHWIEVYSEGGVLLWEDRLDDPEDPLGAQLAASSPLILENGDVLFHNGNVVTSIRCTEAGPADLAWPRFGGNAKNTGNLSDSSINVE